MTDNCPDEEGDGSGRADVGDGKGDDEWDRGGTYESEDGRIPFSNIFTSDDDGWFQIKLPDWLNPRVEASTAKAIDGAAIIGGAIVEMTGGLIRRGLGKLGEGAKKFGGWLRRRKRFDRATEPFVPEEYWQKYAPKQVAPGTGRLDHTRVSGRTGMVEESRVIYDEYGRQIYRVDKTDHARPRGTGGADTGHTNPHLHETTYAPKGTRGHNDATGARETKYNLR